MKGGLHLRRVRVLPDGSCLCVLPSPVQAHRAAGRRYYRKSSARPRRRVRPRPVTGTTVRVIAFTMTITGSDSRNRAGSYFLLTTLPDPVAAPAAELAAAYARRWAVETAFAELKTYLRGGPGTVLRSGDLGGVRQELWAFLVIYQAIRIVICAAAASAGLDPGRVSFTTALHAIRDHSLPVTPPRAGPVASSLPPGPSSAQARPPPPPRPPRRSSPPTAAPRQRLLPPRPADHHHPTRPGHPHQP